MEESTATNPPTADTEAPARAIVRMPAGARVVGLTLIAVGVWALVAHRSTEPPAAWQVINLLMVGFGLAMLQRARARKRADAAQIFLGIFVVMIAVDSLGSWKLFPNETFMTLWPLLPVALGLTLLLTMALTKVRGLMLVALSCIVAGGVALLFTLKIISGAFIEGVGAWWPLPIGLIGLGVLSTALGRLAPEDAADDVETIAAAEWAEGAEEAGEMEGDEA